MISCQWYHSWSVARRTNLILGYLTHPKKEQTQRKSKGHFSLFPFHCISSLLNQVFVVVQQDNHLTLTFIWKGKTLSWARKRRRMKEIESKKITAKLSNLRSREKKRKRERETWLTSRLLFLFSRNKTERSEVSHQKSSSALASSCYLIAEDESLFQRNRSERIDEVLYKELL